MKLYPDAVNNDRHLKKELDVYIPSIKVGVEFDGYKWHQEESDYNNDIIKNNLFAKEGIHLYRIREYGCREMKETPNLSIIMCTYNDNNSLEEAIKKLVKLLGHELDISIQRDENEIRSMYFTNRDKESLEYDNPELAKQWHPTKNGSITPAMVHRGTRKKYWWRCEKGHEWEASVAGRNKVGTGCPYCSNNKILKGYNDFESNNPELMKEWDYEKNTDIMPDSISSGSSQRVWWKCNVCGNEWITTVQSRSDKKRGTGCPKCYSKRRKGCI